MGWPRHREKKKKMGFYGLGRVMVSVDVGLKQLKGTSRGEDSGWERVLVFGGHRDKRVGESACSIFIQFDSEGMLSV